MLSMSFWTTWARLRVQLCVLTRALSSWPLSSLRTCSAWAGLMLTSEKPDNRSDVTSSWARTWGAQGLISTSFSDVWIEDERVTLDSLHGSAAQNGGAANTAPAWYGGAPRSHQMPSPSHPADLGVWEGKGGKWEVMGDKRGNFIFYLCILQFSPPPLHSGQVFLFIVRHVVFGVCLERLVDAIQQPSSLWLRHPQVLLEIQTILKTF